WLYWCDAYYGTVERARFNGAQRQVVVRSSSHPYGIAVYGNVLFWSEFRASRISLVELDSNGDFKSAPRQIYQDDSPVFELHVFDPTRKLNRTSCAESNGGCAHLCFHIDCRELAGCVSPNCSCADGFSIDPSDAGKCARNESYAPTTRCDPTAQFECRNG